MSLLKRLVFAGHRTAARLHLHVLPRHYYSNVVDLHELEETRSTWARRSEMAGVEWDIAAQERALREICLPRRDEYGANETYRAAVAGEFGPGYGPVEAQALHAVVRHFRPRRIIEVGSGVSTACLRAAVELNARDAGSRARITCIEPYPSAALQALHGVDLVSRPVQTVAPAVFEELGEGDFLLIDSSHSAKTGSDVVYLLLEVLPRLRPGVIVHLHDIYLPYDYSPMSLKTLWHWNETAFLHALLIHSRRLKTLFCLSLLHHDRCEVLCELFPGYDPEPMTDGLVTDAVGPLGYPSRHFPSAIYLRIESE